MIRIGEGLFDVDPTPELLEAKRLYDAWPSTDNLERVCTEVRRLTELRDAAAARDAMTRLTRLGVR